MSAPDEFLAELLGEPWPAELPDHLSYSSLTMYHRCREQFRTRYLEGRKEAPKGYQVWGSADSSAAEHNYVQKIDSHEDVPVAEIEEVFADAVDRYVDQFGGESSVEWDDSAKSAADVIDKGYKLAALYHTQVAKRYQPVAAEQKIEIVVPGVAVPIIGYPDVETASTVVERKTAKQKFQKGVPGGDYKMQGRIYQLAKAKPVEWHVSTKTVTPAVYTSLEEPGLQIPWSQAQDAATVRWVQTTVEAILGDLDRFGPEGPWPGSEATKQSPCFWCGFGPAAAKTCFWWN